MADNAPMVKPQPTIRGYNAWVFEKLVERKALNPAEVASWIIDRWVDENKDFLEVTFGITRDEFLNIKKGAEVIDHPRLSSKKGTA